MLTDAAAAMDKASTRWEEICEQEVDMSLSLEQALEVSELKDRLRSLGSLWRETAGQHRERNKRIGDAHLGKPTAISGVEEMMRGY